MNGEERSDDGCVWELEGRTNCGGYWSSRQREGRTALTTSAYVVPILISSMMNGPDE